VALGEMQKIAETTMLPIANYCSLLTTATEVRNDSFSQCILGSEILGGYRPRPRTGRLYSMSDDVVRGRDSFGRRAWERAFEELSAAETQHDLDAADLERLATCAY